MDSIQKVRSLSIWIFIVPFLAINACLIIITNFHDLFPNREDVLVGFIFPYIDGGASISRTARPYPTWLIFKPAMFLTSFLLIKYWIYNKKVIEVFNFENKYKNKIIFFGIASAIALVIHSIFLGIKFDNDLYKLFRRVIMLSFIIFELVAQVYLVICLYKIRLKISNFVNYSVLKIKIALVSVLSIVAIISLPIVTTSGNKIFKHALEWDFFLGIILFYMLTFLMWKKQS